MQFEDLEVFILTYNRSKYLQIQLESICKQTAIGFKIIILNNASTDNTLDVIAGVKEKYPERKIEVITHKENIGNRGNFKMSQKLASTKYCAIFHDDDCFNPEYIETAMKCFYKHPEVGMIASDCTAMFNVNDNNWERQSKSYLLYNSDNFALLNLYGTRQNFASVIYKTDVYKSTIIHDDLCGKIWDLPFMFEVGAKCKTILLEGKYIRYRLSAEQDSNDYATGPFPEQIINALCLCKNSACKYKLYVLILLYIFTKNLYYSLKLYECYSYTWNTFIIHIKKLNLFSTKELLLLKILNHNKVRKYLFKIINKKKNYIRNFI